MDCSKSRPHRLALIGESKFCPYWLVLVRKKTSQHKKSPAKSQTFQAVDPHHRPCGPNVFTEDGLERLIANRLAQLVHIEYRHTFHSPRPCGKTCAYLWFSTGCFCFCNAVQCLHCVSLEADFLVYIVSSPSPALSECSLGAFFCLRCD